MEYKEFLNYVRKGVSGKLWEAGIAKEVDVRKVLKNNDIELDALVVTDNETNVSPTIYLNSYYAESESGRNIDDIVDEIYNLYNEHRGKITLDVKMFGDFKRVRDKIVYKLINSRRNEKLLQDLPFVPFLDLAIVFYFIVDSEECRHATVLIHNDHMRAWSISVEELYKAASENTATLLPPEIHSMHSVVKDMLVTEMKQENLLNSVVKEDSYYEAAAEEKFDELNKLKKEITMYILSNNLKLNGAACILYEGVLEEFSGRMNKDIYILPSSIHEVILVPATEGIQKHELTSMVRDVNDEVVEEGEILSDHAYLYRRDLKQICL